jgi:HTH-type transcriptional regulator/antitoxin HigA
MKTDWKTFETEEEYDLGLARTIELFHAESGTPESDELEILLPLVLAYEDIHYPIPEPNNKKR